MKKWLLGSCLGLICLLILGIYLFIPSKMTISIISLVSRPSNPVFRNLSFENKWRQWFPVDSARSSANGSGMGTGFFYKEYVYRNIKPVNSAVSVTVSDGTDSINTNILIFQIPGDSTVIRWESNISTGLNPVKRVQTYQKALVLKKNMDFILKRFRSFVGDTRNIYGLNIEEVSTRDTLLACIKTVTPVYPTNVYIYRQINIIKDFIQKQKANESGAPLLNVTGLADKSYQVRLAIPVQGKIREEGDVFIQKMVPGNFMSARIKGGPAAINSAIYQMNLYIDDYNKTIMSTPFQSLLTDRSILADSSQWLTGIYFPVIK
jgi:hypothetical protein